MAHLTSLFVSLYRLSARLLLYILSNISSQRTPCLTHLIAYIENYMHSERQPYRERWYYELFKARCFSLIPRQHIVLLLHDKARGRQKLAHKILGVCKNMVQFKKVKRLVKLFLCETFCIRKNCYSMKLRFTFTLLINSIHETQLGYVLYVKVFFLFCSLCPFSE